MPLSLANSPALRAARTIAETLHQAGFQAFFAGGCVRDLLLGLEPQDFDVATDALPDQILQLFPHTIPVGAHFGVVLVLHDTVATEVATFRHDGAYLDGRRPEAVRFSTDPREDVLRRDFTINGMLLDPSAIRPAPAAPSPLDSAIPDPLLIDDNAILDFVGGRRDLAANLVRTIGSPDLRLTEDKLRMLRGVRFAARLDFAFDPETFAAIQRHAPHIAQVSSERVRDELTRMLTEGRARTAFELLDRTGLLAQVLPELTRMHGVAQPPEFHPEGDVWVHTMLLLQHLPPGASPTLAWGMLLHDVGKPATFQPPDPSRPGDRIRFNGHVEVGMRIAEHILDRLRFSNEDKAQIIALIHHHMRFGDVQAMKQSTLKRFLRLDRFEEHLALHRADCLSSFGDLTLYHFARSAYENAAPEEVRPALLLTGRDLIHAGYRPGPAFKAMLLAAEDAQLDGTIATRSQALHLIHQTFGPPCP